jgi:hypothetical protein
VPDSTTWPTTSRNGCFQSRSSALASTRCGGSHKGLPAFSITIAFTVPIFPNLLVVRSGSSESLRCRKGRMAGLEEDSAVPSIAGRRL